MNLIRQTRIVSTEQDEPISNQRARNLVVQELLRKEVSVERRSIALN
jgi:hypothetical protein